MTDIAYLLTPKSDVVWVRAEGTLGQALERMKPNGFSAVPVLDDEGSYVGTLTEGDILWFLLDRATTAPIDPLALASVPLASVPLASVPLASVPLASVPLASVPLRTINRPVHINAKQDTLTRLAAQQNFVPVVDDREAFIGIVRRHSLIVQLVPKRRTAS